jgi:hypothetical protein
LQRIALITRQLLSMTLHLGYPTVTKNHKLTGVTPIAKLTNAHRHPTYSQTNRAHRIPLVAKPTELTVIPPVAKSRTMHIGFAPAAYHEPNQLDPVTQPEPSQPYPN